jgi:hypothetical protein
MELRRAREEEHKKQKEEREKRRWEEPTLSRLTNLLHNLRLHPPPR